MILIIFVILLLISIVSWIYHNNQLKIPHEFGIPLLYNYLTIRSHNKKGTRYDYFLDMIEKNKGIASFQIMMRPPIVLLGNGMDAEYILKTKFSNFDKVDNPAFDEFLGTGIFNVGHVGEKKEFWQDQRKEASHIFKIKEIKSTMSENFLEKGIMLMDVLNLYSLSKEIIDAQELFANLTLATSCKLFFGEEVKSMENYLEKSSSDTNISDFGTSFNQITVLVQKRLQNPFWKFYKNENDRNLSKHIKLVHEFIQKIITKRKDQDLTDKNDLLSRYLKKMREEHKLVDDKYLLDVCTNFLLAGRDTTSQLLTWFFAELSQNKEAQEKVLKEIDETLNGDEPNYENVKQLHYLHHCLQETLRLHPPVPNDAKKCVSDDVLPSGFAVKKGYIVVWSGWCMGRYSKYWHNPNQFIPERWIDKSFNGGIEINPNQHIPFQFGQRRCLGEKMALFQADLTCAMILQKYTLKLKKGFKPNYQQGITLQAKDGMPMTVEKRN
eukprot:TRINITY_DN15290_c0_g1_i1.p1 TRINITY_DN15290_c0_g1~~TRINITY_DN15290_c0_g1_i1.p1  ORF type:complete len:495 (+),score=136.61 TRINITY_DN15290_c0_g1_i1:27-1511(+)